MHLFLINISYYSKHHTIRFSFLRTRKSSFSIVCLMTSICEWGLSRPTLQGSKLVNFHKIKYNTLIYFGRYISFITDIFKVLPSDPTQCVSGLGGLSHNWINKIKFFSAAFLAWEDCLISQNMYNKFTYCFDKINSQVDCFFFLIIQKYELS